MAKRIKLGRRTELPWWALGGYVSSGPILCIGTVQDLGSTFRSPLMICALIAFVAGGLVHVLDRIALHDKAVAKKINESVGAVYDTGKQAGVRNERYRNLVDSDAPLAVVHDLSSPR